MSALSTTEREERLVRLAVQIGYVKDHIERLKFAYEMSNWQMGPQYRTRIAREEHLLRELKDEQASLRLS